jgi:two-component system cell cycle sensor histidine kinase PleC
MSSFGSPVAVSRPPNGEKGEWKAGALAQPLPTFNVSVTCDDAYECFHKQDAALAAAVVDGEGRVVGIVNRLRFLAKYAQRYVPELFSKQPILRLANAKPLIVDEHMSVADLGAMITLDCPDALRECFVVTRSGRYLGIGTSEALVRAKVALLMAREEQLHAALAAAEEAGQAKSNFLALMSHELRTPLNAIIGFSEVLSGELFGPHQIARYGEYARDIHGAGRHLLALINDILDLSKTEAGKLDLDLEPVDLTALFEDCARLMRDRASERGVKLSIVVAEDLPMLQADALRIRQIVLNLLSNSVKFTPAGGKVDLLAGIANDGGVVIAVQDTGIGMAPEMIPIALEPFRQIASPLSRNVEGTGLGLSLVKSLTERHGGRIEIQSTPGAGTIVRLRFPPSCTLPQRAAMVA